MEKVWKFAILGCLFFWMDVTGNPTKPTVVSGEAVFTPSTAEVLEIAVSDRAIINWETFSIRQNESTRFLQPSVNSSVLNRVLSDCPSQIMGMLESNGRVILINPNGIVVDKNGVVNTGAFIASTLDLLDEKFLENSELFFKGESKASIVHLGTIRAYSGDVALLGRTIENKGEILAPNGTGAIVAAQEILIMPEGKQRFLIRPQNSERREGTGILNEGTIQAMEVELRADGNPYALAIQHSGEIGALGIEERGGRVFLTGEKGAIEITGSVQAVASSGVGGDAYILADTIYLKDEGSVDVSGDHGGGKILVGGDERGSNPEIYQAKELYADSGTLLQANAIEDGDGGKIVAWATDLTCYLGKIEAKGGQNFGDGGFVEVSSPGRFSYVGQTFTTAPNGNIGRLLLDPTEIDIIGATAGVALAACGFPATTYASMVPMGTLDVATLAMSLMGSSITVTTYDGSCGPFGGDGSITLSSALAFLGGSVGDLTFDAAGDININAAINDMGTTRDLTFITPTDININEVISMTGTILIHGPLGLLDPVGTIYIGAAGLGNSSGLLAEDISLIAENVIAIADTDNVDIRGVATTHITTIASGMDSGKLSLQTIGTGSIDVSTGGALDTDLLTLDIGGDFLATGPTIPAMTAGSVTFTGQGEANLTYHGAGILDAKNGQCIVQIKNKITLIGDGTYLQGISGPPGSLTLSADDGHLRLVVQGASVAPAPQLSLSIAGDLTLTAATGTAFPLVALGGPLGPVSIAIDLNVANLVLNGGASSAALIGSPNLIFPMFMGNCDISITATGSQGITLNGGASPAAITSFGGMGPPSSITLAVPNGSILLNGAASVHSASIQSNGGPIDLSVGKDIILSGTSSNTDAIIFDTNTTMGAGTLNAIAGNSISLNEFSSVNLSGNITFVIDNNNPSPPNIGMVTFSTGLGSAISANSDLGDIQIFTTVPSLVTIDGTLNGVNFVQGTPGVDTDQEHFFVYSPNAFINPMAPFFTVFYKGLSIPIPGPGPITEEEIRNSFAYYEIAEVAFQEFLTDLQAYSGFDYFNFTELYFMMTLGKNLFVGSSSEEIKTSIFHRDYTIFNLRRINLLK